MRAATSISLLCAAAALIAAAAWWSARGTSGAALDVASDRAAIPRAETADAEDAEAADTAAGAPAAAPVEAPPSARAEPDARLADDEELEAGMFVDPLEALLGGTKAPAPEQFAGLWGRIVDGHGKPVTDARVFATTDAEASGALLDAPANRGRAREDKTTAAGRFEFLGLRAGSLRLAVRARGFTPLDLAPRSLSGGDRIDLGELALEPGVVLAGSVVDATGRPVAGAAVLRVSEPLFGPVQELGALPASPLATSDAEGRFETAAIASGVHTLRVFHAEFPDAVIEVRAPAEAERVENVRIALPPAENVSGRVLDFDLHPLPALVAVAMPEAGIELLGGARPPGGNSYWLAGVRSAPVDATGRFELRGLEPGSRYRVRLQRSDAPVEGFDARSQDPWAPSVAVVAGASTGELELVFRAGASFRLEVVDRASGAPVELMRVSLAGAQIPGILDAKGKPRLRFPGGVVQSGELRPFVITPGLVVHPNAPATVDVTVDAPGHAFASTSYRLSSGIDVDLGRLELVPLPTIEVRVEDAHDGTPLAGARVVLTAKEDAGDPGRDRSSGITGAGGLVQLTSLTCARATLSVSRPGYVECELPASGSAVAGAAPTVVALTRGGHLRVTVLDAAGAPCRGARATVRPSVPDEKNSWFVPLDTDATGAAVWRDLAAGEYTVSASRVDDLDAFEGGSSDDVWRVIHESRDAAGEGQVVAVIPGVEATAVLRVGGLSRLEGTLRYGDVPLGDALVCIERGPSGFDDFGCSQESFQTAFRLHTDARGRFRALELAPGDYTLLIDQPLLGVLTRRIVQVGREPTRVELDVGDTELSGRVVDAAGAPVAGAKVRLLPHFNLGKSAWLTKIGDPLARPRDPRRALAEAVSDEDGIFHLRATSAGAHMDLMVWHGRRAGSGRNIVGRQGERVPVREVTVQEPGSVEIALDPRGIPLGQRWAVRATAHFQPDGQGLAEAVFGEDSRARLSNLAAGPWELTLFAIDERELLASEPQVRKLVSVKPGAAVELALRP